MYFIYLLLLIPACLFSGPIVLDTWEVSIPGVRNTYNPTMTCWSGQTVMAYRYQVKSKKFSKNRIGIVLLNENFETASTPQELYLRDAKGLPLNALDPRLIVMNDRLFLTFSHWWVDRNKEHRDEVRLVELFLNGNRFSLGMHLRLKAPEELAFKPREKNWMPFTDQGQLFFIYSPHPHQVIEPDLQSGQTALISSDSYKSHWQWGELRGGTQALLVDGEYLTFFHSSTNITNVTSKYHGSLKYYIGAYTFSAQPPFTITKMSPSPIVGKKFYGGRSRSGRLVVFPCGFLVDDSTIYLSFGKNDKKIMISKLDKDELLKSLVPVSLAP